NTGVVVLVILFQPELRKALEQLGRSSFISSGSGSHSSSANTSQIVSEIVTAMTDMSKKRIGALIVVERKTGLREFADTGTMINADITAPLIENIFEPNTPLHDGAMIIRDGRILAAACILQLSNDPDISKELGTRHRAAIGITETSDAVALVVSEETGVISAAREGRLNRYIDQKTLTGILTELFEGKLGRSVRLLKPSGGEAGK
ncbi:MAG: diadenylate cyclase CdaA, partial [Clostridia bacterium]|nr:diadenylate cyclase CdaA [Clostridia bacterium]